VRKVVRDKTSFIMHHDFRAKMMRLSRPLP
jgi:hypothetical protein